MKKFIECNNFNIGVFILLAILIFIMIGLIKTVSAKPLYVKFYCTHPTTQEATKLYQAGYEALKINQAIPAYEKGIILQKYPKAVTELCFKYQNYIYTKINTHAGKIIVCRNINVPNGCLVMNTRTQKIYWYCAKNASRGGIFEIK